MDTGPDEHHRATGEMANQMNQHIEMPQIQYTDKVADKSVAVQRQVSPRTTETEASEYSGDSGPQVSVGGPTRWRRRQGRPRRSHYQILLVRRKEYGKH